MQTIEVLVIDEHSHVRQLLEDGLNMSERLRVVATTGSPLEGLGLAGRLRPEVILVDVRRRGRFGTEVYRRLHQASPGSHLVVFTSYLGPDEEQLARDAGASLCLLKGMPLKRLAEELLRLCNGTQDGAEEA
jgi:two-component system response regulator DesR